MSNFGKYMEPEGGPLSWYSTMRNIKRQGDQDFYLNTGGGPGLVGKIKGLFAKAQGSPLRQPSGQAAHTIQRPGAIGIGEFGRAGFFRAVQDLFLNRRDNSHARARHHHFRNPEEGVSRPGFIRTAPQQDRPGFIMAGLGQASPAVGAEIISETKEKGSQILLIVLVLGILLWTKSRIF